MRINQTRETKPEKYSMQGHLDYISSWTDRNLMKLNEAKCNYLVFTRTKKNVGTRRAINDVVMNRISVTKILGVCVGVSRTFTSSFEVYLNTALFYFIQA